MPSQSRLHRLRVTTGLDLDPGGAAAAHSVTKSAIIAMSSCSRHPVVLATHDEKLVHTLRQRHGSALTEPGVEFEMLLGLGTDLLDQLHHDGFRTREYVIFGDDWWLYVLNRIAEDPTRAIAALADLRSAPGAGQVRPVP